MSCRRWDTTEQDEPASRLDRDGTLRFDMDAGPAQGYADKARGRNVAWLLLAAFVVAMLGVLGVVAMRSGDAGKLRAAPPATGGAR